ncbi:hypothetical protein COOONC_27606 [Cooperia oncophora]
MSEYITALAVLVDGPVLSVTLLSQRYEDATGEEMRVPVHLKSLEETILNTRRSQLASKSEGTKRRSRTTTPLPHLMERVRDVFMDTESPSASSALPTPRHTEKPVGNRTPATDFISSARKGYSTPRPRTPENEPPLPPPPPIASVVGPPPAAFTPHFPPSMLPPFHSGQSCADSEGLTSNPEDYRRRGCGVCSPASISYNDYSGMPHNNSGFWSPFSYYSTGNTYNSLPNDLQSTSCYSYSACSPVESTSGRLRHGYAGFGDEYGERSDFQRRSRYYDRRWRCLQAETHASRSPYYRRHHGGVGNPFRGYRTPPLPRASRREDHRQGDFVIKRYRYDVPPSHLSCKSSNRDMNNNSSCSNGHVESNTPNHPPRKKSRWDCAHGAETTEGLIDFILLCSFDFHRAEIWQVLFFLPRVVPAVSLVLFDERLISKAILSLLLVSILQQVA